MFIRLSIFVFRVSLSRFYPPSIIGLVVSKAELVPVPLHCYAVIVCNVQVHLNLSYDDEGRPGPIGSRAHRPDGPQSGARQICAFFSVHCQHRTNRKRDVLRKLRKSQRTCLLVKRTYKTKNVPMDRGLPAIITFKYV